MRLRVQEAVSDAGEASPKMTRTLFGDVEALRAIRVVVSATEEFSEDWVIST